MPDQCNVCCTVQRVTLNVKFKNPVSNIIETILEMHHKGPPYSLSMDLDFKQFHDR